MAAATRKGLFASDEGRLERGLSAPNKRKRVGNSNHGDFFVSLRTKKHLRNEWRICGSAFAFGKKKSVRTWLWLYGRLLILQAEACICFLSVFHYLFRVHQRQLLQMLSPRLRSLAIHFIRSQGTLANLVMGLWSLRFKANQNSFFWPIHYTQGLHKPGEIHY